MVAAKYAAQRARGKCCKMCVKKFDIRAMIQAAEADHERLQPVIEEKLKLYKEKEREAVKLNPESQELLDLRKDLIDQDFNIERQKKLLKKLNDKRLMREERTDWLHEIEQKIKEQISQLQKELDAEDNLMQQSEILRNQLRQLLLKNNDGVTYQV